METNRLELFDVDHTLLHSNVSYAFGKELFYKGLFSKVAFFFLVFCYMLHKAHILPLKTLHELSFYLLFYKKEKKKIEALADAFIEANLSLLIRPSVLQELEAARTKGHALWLQSSSPDFLIQPIAKRLKIKTILATSYATNELGFYEKIEKIVDGVAKRKALIDFLDDKGYSNREVTCYSDSRIDLPVLECAGIQVAVCPDRKLKKIALKNGWKIINK